MLPQSDISILIIHQFPLKVHCKAKRSRAELGSKVTSYERLSSVRNWIFGVYLPGERLGSVE